jgi:hypothetical protein
MAAECFPEFLKSLQQYQWKQHVPLRNVWITSKLKIDASCYSETSISLQPWRRRQKITIWTFAAMKNSNLHKRNLLLQSSESDDGGSSYFETSLTIYQTTWHHMSETTGMRISELIPWWADYCSRNIKFTKHSCQHRRFGFTSRFGKCCLPH